MDAVASRYSPVNVRYPHLSSIHIPLLLLALSALSRVFGPSPLSPSTPSISLSDSIAALSHVYTTQVHHPGIQPLLYGFSTGSLVLEQSVCPRKILLAGLTSVGLFSAVCPLVPLHVVLLNETHVTLVTAEWLLSTVDFLVSLEEVFLNETHVALVASEGSFTCVNEDMSA